MVSYKVLDKYKIKIFNNLNNILITRVKYILGSTKRQLLNII